MLLMQMRFLGRNITFQRSLQEKTYGRISSQLPGLAIPAILKSNSSQVK